MIKYIKEGKLWLHVVYFVLALVVVLPLFKSGHIFALDITTVPHFKFPTEISYGWFYLVGLWFLDLILPTALVYKVVFFLIIFLGGIGMHRLCKDMHLKWS